MTKWGNKKSSGTNRNFLESYLAEFKWTLFGQQSRREIISKNNN